MTSYWEANITLIDSAEVKTSMRFVIGELTDVDFSAEAGLAKSRMDTLVTDLKAISDANVYRAYLKGDAQTWDDAGLPADADITDELVIVAHTNDTGNVTEVDQLRVPAPIATVFLNSDRAEGLDVTNALVQAYVANFDAEFQFSDGEYVNLAEGTQGIQDGYWRSRPKALR